MKFNVTFDESRLRKKLATINTAISKENADAVLFYGQSFCKLAYKFTPPGDGQRTPGQSLRRLKARIQSDLLGDKVKDGEMGYYRRDGKLFCYYKTEAIVRKLGKSKQKIVFRKKASGKRPSPFDLLGRVPKGIVPVPAEWHLRKFQVGRRKGAAHLIWYGHRPPARRSVVKEAALYRQKKAGTLMAGWNATAELCGARIPDGVPGGTSKGRATIEKSFRHQAILKATNTVPYGELARLTKMHMGGIQAAALRAAKTRERILKAKLKAVT